MERSAEQLRVLYLLYKTLEHILKETSTVDELSSLPLLDKNQMIFLLLQSLRYKSIIALFISAKSISVLFKSLVLST